MRHYLRAPAGTPGGRIDKVTLRDEFDERNRQWRLFHEWEAQQPPVSRDLSAVFADLSALRRLCPPELLSAVPDPEKVGIARMRAALALLSGQ